MRECRCREWHHAIGNHELYNFTRDELRAKLEAGLAASPEPHTAKSDGDACVRNTPTTDPRASEPE